ncbi:oocyte zinc finger protein XlCOF7.1-like [Rana temporaria]|uniref:oocyte zinc finger protein XlCOF7.1-like n=1 Tax=Rana temporaria TaxID=8407 RepID=UPI001AACD3B7|nr:oocyte zinc finger protein XlCOF7.1-like [Rana temporaria]
MEKGKMEKGKSEMSERIINITLEIIYLLTGEDCIVVKKSSGDCVAASSHALGSAGTSHAHITSKLLGPFQKRKNNYQILKLANKIIELLTGEELECVDDDKDEVMEVHEPLSSPDGSSNRNTPERCPVSPDPADDDQDYEDDMECIDLTLPKKGNQEKSHVIEERDEMTERLLNLSLEIIYLLTGEDCIVLRKTSGELLTSRNRSQTSSAWSRSQSPDTVPSPLSLVNKNNKEQKILEVTHKIIEVLTGEVWGSDDDYKEEVIQDHHSVSSSDGSSNVVSQEESPNPHFSRDCIDVRHGVTRFYQDEHVGDFKIFVKQEKKEEQGADDEVIHVTIKEEEYPPDIGIDGRRIRRTAEGCLILSCDMENDVVQDSPEEEDDEEDEEEEDNPVTIDVQPEDCTEKALDLSNTGGSSPEIITHTVGNIVLNPNFDGFYVEKPKPRQKRTPQPKPPPQPKVRRRKTPVDEKRFQCCECGKFFPHKSYLIKHERSHTGEKPFICSECGKCFTDNSGLMKHVRIHLTERPYQCCSCGKGFTYKADLIKHERIHTGEKPFPCSKCGKCFTDKSGRAKHERIHSGEKPFPCPICGKCFSRKSHMAKHQIIHTGEKPFLCQECGRCFGRKSHLTNHQILHRGEKPYMCPECGKCFAQRPGLIIHRKIHKPKVVPPVS